MTELAEPIAIGGLPGEIEIKCPFADETLGVDSIEGEDIARDDRAAARAQQSNNGGVLGANLESASPGKDGTVGGPYPPPTVEKSPRLDTRRKKLRVRVPGTATIPEGIYGFTVAAHHLIPGEASLAPSKLKPFMEKGGSVEVVGEKGKKTKKVRKHIGYNVNGAHNGHPQQNVADQGQDVVRIGRRRLVPALRRRRIDGSQRPDSRRAQEIQRSGRRVVEQDRQDIEPA